MVSKCFCDNCQREGAGRVTVTVARSASLQMIGDSKDMDADLCQECFDKFLATIRSVKIIDSRVRAMAAQQTR